MSEPNASACTVYDIVEGFPDGCVPATMRQILASGPLVGDDSIKSLGRATVASILNALEFAPAYPLTAQRVIEMFNAVHRGGNLKVNATTAWDADQVRAYFESLYA